MKIALKWLDENIDEAARGLELILAKMFKSLGDPGRIEILKLTNPDPKTFNELKRLLEVNPNTLSRGLKELQRNGLIEKRTDGYAATSIGTRMLNAAIEQVSR